MRGKGTLVAAALAGLFAAGCNTSKPAPKSEAKAEKVKCQGVNECSGKGGCAGGGHDCAGKNGCKGQSFVEVASAADCTAKGGKVQ